MHVDAYRLENEKDLVVLDLDEELMEPGTAVLIEWPEQAKDLLPDKTMWLKFKYGKKENERTITIKR